MTVKPKDYVLIVMNDTIGATVAKTKGCYYYFPHLTLPILILITSQMMYLL